MTGAEHAIVCLEASFDTKALDLAQAFMAANGELASQLDRLTGGGLPGAGWHVVSHDVLVVGERSLMTLILQRD